MSMKRWPVMVLAAALAGGAIGVSAWVQRPDPAAAAQRGGDGLSEYVEPVPADLREGRDKRQIIGWDQANERLGRDMPTGRGIAVGIVEAGEAYGPNSRDERLRGISFILQSGDTGNSGHASGVARNAFGRSAPAPGVARVHCFSVNHWMTDGYLNAGTDQPPDDWNESRLFNHSWVAQDANYAPEVLRRVDWLADEKDILCIVGLNNGPGPTPHLLGSAYNTISVGVLTGAHSRGTTRIDGEGRCKPELIAPGRLTSWSTPAVTGCAAVLLERADELAERGPESPDRHAQRSEVIKALLMGGAFKPDEWAPAEGQPLDRQWGAGIVDLDRALLMIDSGNTPPGDTNQRYGWSFQTLAPNDSNGYTFTTTADQGEACFTLVWHRRIAGGAVTVRNNATGETRRLWNNTPALADLDLELVRVLDTGEEERVALSASAVDNVEVVYLRELPAGTYTVRVLRGDGGIDAAWDYALAWRIEAE